MCFREERLCYTKKAGTMMLTDVSNSQYLLLSVQNSKPRIHTIIGAPGFWATRVAITKMSFLNWRS